MQHAIPLDELGAQGPAMADAIGSCVHCGFCLPTCPTYVTGGEEPHSPRGRIFLMKDVLEGSVGLEEALAPIDSCLGCQACVTACPSGVEYGELITAFRAHAEPRRPLAERATRALAAHTLPYPRRFRAAARLGRLAPKVAALRPMLDLLPDRMPKARPLPAVFPAEGARRARVALLAGCAQQVLDPDIGWATLRVLARNGVETVVPRGQGCCGALAMHGGRAAQARRLARRNLRAFPEDVDAVVANAAGCGSGMREYGLLFAGEPDEEQARELAARVVDVSAFLDELGLRGAAGPAAAARRVPRRVPPGARAEGARGAAAAAARGRPRGRGAGRVGAVLRLGRDLQRRAAGDGRRARPPQGGQPARHRGGRGRGGEHRLPDADPAVPGPAGAAHDPDPGPRLRGG